MFEEMEGIEEKEIQNHLFSSRVDVRCSLELI